jgi:ribosomal protein S18 acetylase RimI-like enzyme
MSADVLVRRATAGDAGALASLVREYWEFEGIDGFDDASCRRVLGDFLADERAGLAWIAERGGEAVGYLVACLVFSLEHGGRTAEIDEFFVVPSCRGAGLGEMLLAAAEEAFEAAGLTSVSMQVGAGNDGAARFYARLGYAPRNGYRLMDKHLAAHRTRRSSPS